MPASPRPRRAGARAAPARPPKPRSSSRATSSAVRPRTPVRSTTASSSASDSAAAPCASRRSRGRSRVRCIASVHEFARAQSCDCRRRRAVRRGRTCERESRCAQCKLRPHAPRIGRMDDHDERRSRTLDTSRAIVLGVTGGIAAYKAAELTRLLVKDGVDVDVVMTEARARASSPPLTFQALSGRAGAHRPVGHPAPTTRWATSSCLARRRRDRRRARLGGFPRQARARPRRRPALDAVPRARLPAARRAGDEPPDVGATPPRSATSRSSRRRRAILGPGSGDQACGEIGDGPHARARGDLRGARRVRGSRSCSRASACCVTAGPDVRGDRPGARHHQLQLGQDGLRDRAGRRRGRR